ncbi:hypothetical protein RB623_10480 [Mesorhizobium sp. LHD-90]|uniref:hypothetical protein n=1 Tax=Mesorhizobium sp. LHD-90 TaxID=3071414 RepID=UPI0027DFB565|nr:hypothetical protein [Mesorhizobium sp. LHD-90]MDQ6434474.1 hypothetical protein [Mesorhizobium sp. LHD-90]
MMFMTRGLNSGSAKRNCREGREENGDDQKWKERSFAPRLDIFRQHLQPIFRIAPLDAPERMDVISRHSANLHDKN